MSRSRLIALIATVALVACAAPANAASCATEIVAFRQSLRQSEDATTGVVGSAPQSIDAQLEHQPTPASVDLAKKKAKTHVVALLREAESLNAQGRRRACLRTLQRANLLLNP